MALQSTAKLDGDSAIITYSVANQSDTPLSVLLNISASKTILYEAPLIQRAFMLEPKASRSFTVTQEGHVSIETGAIVIYDVNKQIVAIDLGGFYTIKDSKARSDNSFWDSLK